MEGREDNSNTVATKRPTHVHIRDVTLASRTCFVFGRFRVHYLGPENGTPHNLEISHHFNIKNLVRQKNNSDITRRYVRDPSWGSSVSVVSDNRLDERASIPSRGNGFFL
jgi:hypothetical protein